MQLGRLRLHPRPFAVVGVACIAVGGAQVVLPRQVAAQAEAMTAFGFSEPGSVVNSLVTGPDGALWFTWQTFVSHGLARMTVGGVATTFASPSGWGAPVNMGHVTTGAGSLWVTEAHDSHGYIGRWNTSGSLTAEHQLPSPAYAIAYGPDGNLWFSGGNSSGPGPVSNSYIGRMTPSGTVTAFPMPDAGDLAAELTTGPDGALWFSEGPGPNVGRITMAGTITEFPISGAQSIAGPEAATQDITTGADGALWLAGGSAGLQRVTTTGSFTHISSRNDCCDFPKSITSGPDGNLWFTVPAANSWVGKLTTAGVISVYPVPSSIVDGLPTVITTGPDRALWFGAQGELVRLDPTIAPDGGASVSVPDTGSGGLLLLGAPVAAAGIALLLFARRRRPSAGG